MKVRSRAVPFLAAGLVVTAIGTIACGNGAMQPQVTIDVGSTLAFSPAGVVVQRTPAACGAADPPYSKGDLYSFQALGGGDPSAGPVTTIGIDFQTPLQEHAAMELSLHPRATASLPGKGAYVTQSGSTPGTTLGFGFQWGANPAEIDASALRRVEVTVVAIPHADGDPLTVRYVLFFDDGATLDETVSAAVQTFTGSCAAG